MRNATFETGLTSSLAKPKKGESGLNYGIEYCSLVASIISVMTQCTVITFIGHSHDLCNEIIS